MFNSWRILLVVHVVSKERWRELHLKENVRCLKWRADPWTLLALPRVQHLQTDTCFMFPDISGPSNPLYYIWHFRFEIYKPNFHSPNQQVHIRWEMSTNIRRFRFLFQIFYNAFWQYRVVPISCRHGEMINWREHPFATIFRHSAGGDSLTRRYKNSRETD